MGIFIVTADVTAYGTADYEVEADSEHDARMKVLCGDGGIPFDTNLDVGNVERILKIEEEDDDE